MATTRRDGARERLLIGLRIRDVRLQYGHSLEREACYLCVHSVLHLLGYDHLDPDDQARMRRREEEILHTFDLSREN